MNTALRRVTALLSAGALLSTVLVFAASTAASAASSTGASLDLCVTPSPGYAQCLGIRQLPGSQVTANSAHQAVTPDLAPSGLKPADLVSAYQLDTTRGAGQLVAIVDAYDDPAAEADLASYRAHWGLPACTTANGCFSKVNQSGGTSPLPTANAGWAAEISLDVDMVSAICPKCRILLVEATSSLLSDLGTSVNTAVASGAKFVSNSYGGSEGSWASQEDAYYYNHPGVAITASTGDDGYGVSYPASSPFVTAVGGTSLTTANNSRGWTETAWTGAGSGCSSYSTKPAAQATVSTGCGGRGVADVSAVADPATGVAVYDTYNGGDSRYGGGWGQYGGTSASSPIVAATYALAGTPGASDYPNSYPYADTADLTDVTSGANCSALNTNCSNSTCATISWCTAGSGWDGPTGLGTPLTSAAFAAPGNVTDPRTTLTAALGSNVVAYGGTVQVSGTLSRVLGSTVSPLVGANIRITGNTGTGTAAQVGNAVTTANGSWSALIPVRATAWISATYAGATDQPAATAAAGMVRVASWTTRTTLATQYRTLTAGGADTVSGAVVRTYGGVSSDASGVTTRIYLGTRTGATVLLATTTTNSAGRFSAVVRPTENGVLTARVTSVTGYANSISPGIAITVSTKAAIAAPARIGRRVAFTLSASISVARKGTVTIQVQRGARWVTSTVALTAVSGVVHLRMAGLAAGTYRYRTVFAGDNRGGSGVSGVVSVRVP